MIKISNPLCKNLQLLYFWAWHHPIFRYLFFSFSVGWRCKRYGHRTGDRECPFFIKGNQKLEQFRVVSLTVWWTTARPQLSNNTPLQSEEFRFGCGKVKERWQRQRFESSLWAKVGTLLVSTCGQQTPPRSLCDCNATLQERSASAMITINATVSYFLALYCLNNISADTTLLYICIV